jgi:hypothetical protein
MAQPDIILGELRSVHRPQRWRLWFMAIVSLGPLLMLGLGIVLLIDDFAHGREAKVSTLSTRFGCLGAIALILALLISLLVSEFRKWHPTRSVELRIFENGFTYQKQKGIQACAWNEIKDITHRTLTISSKHSAPRRVSVIRSIVKTDGTVIVLAETLNLHKLTTLIRAGTSAQ